MLGKMKLIPSDRLHGSLLMKREPTVSIRKQKQPVKKRKYHHHPYAEAVKIRKHHPYEQWLKVRQKIDEADLRKKNRDECICRYFLPSDASWAS